jgi:hypothetical protein
MTTSNLSSKALLISLNISQWTGRRLDRTATHTVESAHATDGHVGNFHKRLLPQCDALEAIRKQAALIREFHYRETLPWLSDGSRILSAQNYLPYMTALRPLIDQFRALVSDLIAVYPVEVQRAQVRLGTLFNVSNYPSPDNLARLFDVSANVFPLPDASDFRVQITDAERASFIQKIQDAENLALSDCHTRLREVIARATERLAQPDAIFRDTLIDNIREVLDVLPRLDFSSNPNLAAFRARTESALTGVTPKDLRESSGLRETAARNLSTILSDMSAYASGMSDPGVA